MSRTPIARASARSPADSAELKRDAEERIAQLEDAPPHLLMCGGTAERVYCAAFVPAFLSIAPLPLRRRPLANAPTLGVAARSSPLRRIRRPLKVGDPHAPDRNHRRVATASFDRNREGRSGRG